MPGFRRVVRCATVLMMVFCLLSPARRAFADGSHPNVARGFNPETPYHVADLDSVNVFNGNLVVTVPIGQEYRVGGNLSYSFKLVYNGQLWTYRHVSPSDATPGTRSNVALGWQFSLGELSSPDLSLVSANAPPHQWIFYTPDGGSHAFYKVLHPAQKDTDLQARFGNNKVYGYTRDMSYLRLFGGVATEVARGDGHPHLVYFGQMTVQMPNGTEYVFRSAAGDEELTAPATDVKYYLHAIRDAFGNEMRVEYQYKDADGVLQPDVMGHPGEADAWKITELPAGGAEGRTHLVLFEEEDWYQTKPGNSTYTSPDVLTTAPIVKKKIVREVRLAARGGTAVYSFVTEFKMINEPCDAFVGWKDRRMKARFLYTINGPEGLKYGATYRELGPSSSSCSATAGHMTSLTLPTGAGITYELGRRRFPLVPDYADDPRYVCSDAHRAYYNGDQCPTGGRNDSGFCNPGFDPPSTCIDESGGRLRNGGDHRPPFSDPVSVVARTVTHPDGTATTHEYNAATRCGVPRGERFQEMVAIIDAPEGERTLHYFVVDPSDVTGSDYPAALDEYGLPYSKLPQSEATTLLPDWAKGYFLSTETMASSACTPFPDALTSCGIVNQCGDQVMRRTYVKYETEPYIRSDGTDSPEEGGGMTDLNRRLRGTITITRKYDHNQGKWVDDLCPDGLPCYTKVDYDDYDGLGHFRKETRTSNMTLGRTPLNAALSRTLTTSYDRAVPPSAEPLWLFGQFANKKVDFGAGDLKLAEFCWDTAGYMTRKRDYRGMTGDEVPQPDILNVFTRDAQGNTTEESRYGVMENFATCASELSSATPAGKVTSTWLYGTLATSQIDGAPFKTTDLDIDAATGLAIASRDGNQRVTCYEYDLLGRLKMTRPPGTDAESWFEYGWYDSATNRPSHASAKRLPRSSAQCSSPQQPTAASLTESHYYYDGIGRLIQSRTRTPEGKWATATTAYDKDGRKASVSIPVALETSSYAATIDPAPKTTRYFYDALGRVIKTVAPDESAVDQTYVGDREILRGAKVATTPGDTLQQTLFVTAEAYDGLGRLAQVREPLSAEEVTDYFYDFGDRLTGVTQGAASRTFSYDRVGLLRTEKHPEQGEVSYTHDVRGRLLTKQLGSLISLSHKYDVADRLLEVLDQKTGKVLKEFVYDSDGGASEPGKLLRQVRHNYFSDSKYSVSDVFHYDATTGRLDLKNTEVSRFNAAGALTDKTKTSQSYSYDTLGLSSAIRFPECQSCGTFPLGPRSLSLTRSEGMLTGIQGAATNIAYAASGAIKQVVHATSEAGAVGVTDEYEQDSTGARPKNIKFSNVRNCLLILGPPTGRTVPEGSSAVFTMTVAAGAAIQWYEGTTGDVTKPVSGDTTFTTPPLTQSKTYWARVTAPSSGCIEDTPTITAEVCKDPSVRTPEATSSTRAFAGVPMKIAVDVSGPASYQWQWIRDEEHHGPIGANDAVVTFTPSNDDVGATVKIVVTVTSKCKEIPFAKVVTVAKLDVVAAPACTAEFEPSQTTVFPKTYTVIPNEHSSQVVQLKAPPDVNASYAKLVYSFRWVQDGAVLKNDDRTWITGSPAPATPADRPSRSEVLFQFVDQSVLRLEAWVSCYSGVADTTPYAVSKPVSTQSFGVMNGHCPVPDVTVAPASALLGTAPATLRAESQYPDATFVWYSGEPGNTTFEAGRGNSLTVSTAGIYWVRVSSECAFKDSAPVVVSSAAGSCQPVRILREPVGASIAAGDPVTLSVDAAGVPTPSYYLWTVTWNGPTALDPGDQPIAGTNGKTSIVVAPLETTDYAVRVGNGISAFNDCSLTQSRVARVRVVSCRDIELVQPRDEVLSASADSVELAVTATPRISGTLKYQWFIGESGDMSKPVDPAIDGGPRLRLRYEDHLKNLATNKFWVKVSFETLPGAPKRCAVDSQTVTVCRLPRITNPLGGGFSNSVPNLRRDLAIGAAGDGITYAWYEGDGDGAAPDKSHPLPSKSNAVSVWPVVTTKYYVEIVSGCSPATVARYTAQVSVCPLFESAPTADKTLVNVNSTTVLHADVKRGDRIEWYTLSAQGAATLVPSMTGANPTTIPIAATTRFFARAWSGDCHRDSEPVTINACSGPTVSYTTATPTTVIQNVPTMLVQKNKLQSITAIAGVNDGPLAWQWYRGNTAGDVTNSTPVSSSVTFDTYPDQTASYWVRGTNNTTGCYGNSVLLAIKVCVPTIIQSPSSVMVNSGSSATLTVTTDNLQGVTYQWYVGQPGNVAVKAEGPNFPGATTGTLTVLSATADTTYWVRVFGCDGTMSQDSAAATISICRPPAITQQPQSQVLAAAGSAEVKVVATGTDLAYQWYKGATGDLSNPIADSNAASRTQNPQYTTKYWVRITGRCGTIDSASATLARPPVIQTQPAGRLITKGTSAQLSVTALGNELTYQWYQRTGSGIVAVSGQTAAIYTIPAVNADTTVFCRVYSGSSMTALAQTDSADATLTVCQPRTLRVVGTPNQVSGSDVTMQVDSPDASETYEWYAVAGGTTTQAGTGTSITVRPLVTTDYFLRTVRPSCTADSPAVTIRICYPNITAQPQSVGTVYGTSKRLTVTATGNPALTYQWYRGASGDLSSPIDLATSSIYDTPANAGTTSYWVRVSSPANGACASTSVNSAAAVVAVCQPPSISQQPQPNKMIKGTQSTVSVVAAGEGLHYQWYEGAAGTTTKPVGFDSASFTFTANATTSYWVRVTGTCGTADSVAALQSVAPQISQQPVAFTGCGNTHSYSVVASGVEAYTWYSEVAGVRTVVGTASSASVTITTLPTKVWVELRSGEAYVSSNTITVSSIRPTPTINNFTATQSSPATNWILSVSVPSSETPYVWCKFYQGALGNTSTLLADSSFKFKTVTVTSTPAKYWVRVYFTDTLCYTDREVTIP